MKKKRKNIPYYKKYLFSLGTNVLSMEGEGGVDSDGSGQYSILIWAPSKPIVRISESQIQRYNHMGYLEHASEDSPVEDSSQDRNLSYDLVSV